MKRRCTSPDTTCRKIYNRAKGAHKLNWVTGHSFPMNPLQKWLAGESVLKNCN